jgi:antitoxin VapB
MYKVTAKVFMNGRSQAIRLPKAFRVEGSEVYIRKEDNKLVIEPKPQISWAEFFKTFKGDSSFDVNRAGIKDKPRNVDL